MHHISQWKVFNIQCFRLSLEKELPNGIPTRLTTGTDFEFEPVISPDGNNIVYVNWNDLEKGAIFSVPFSGGAPTKLTSEKGIYRTPLIFT